MTVTGNTTPAASSDRPLPAMIPQGSGRGRTLTVIRMGLAFFFPWPFGTDDLKTAVANRARRIRWSPARRASKS